MFRRPSILSLLSICALVAQTIPAAEPTGRPNIILLLADDLGWTGLGCFGSDLYETPHLDRLAERGLKFTNAYAACTVCSPTRASVMTGMYPARLQLTDFIAGQNRPWARMKIPDWTKQLDHAHMTVAEALKGHGYRTVHVGKWHLGRNNADPEGAPLTHGFDEQYLKPGEAKGYQLPKGFNRDGPSQSDYLTDYLTDQAIGVIEQGGKKPLFLYFAYHTPHTPIQGRKDLVEYFSGKVKSGARHNNPDYAAMVHSLDHSVGRLVKSLTQQRLLEHTVLIFLSDNGGLTQRYGKPDHFTDNYPLRRGKGSAYEGGVRVPAIVSWPGVTSPGSVCDTPIASIDLYPTILSLAGIDDPKLLHGQLDGIDLCPILADPRHKVSRDLFWHYPHYHAGGDGPYSAVRSGDWKLIHRHEDDRWQLFHLASDLGEATDLSSRNHDTASILREKLLAWRRSVGAQMPTPNPHHDPARAQQVARRPKKK